MDNQNFMADKHMIDLINELKQLKEEIKCLEEREKKIKDDINEIIGYAEAICNEEGTVLATYKFSERLTFDAKAFKQSAPSIYEHYCKPIVTRTFLIKE